VLRHRADQRLKDGTDMGTTASMPRQLPSSVAKRVISAVEPAISANSALPWACAGSGRYAAKDRRRSCGK